MESGTDAMRRYRNGRSQEWLARQVGMSTTAISQIERGLNVPRYDNAAKIDEALGAGGEVLAGFGYASVTQPADVVVRRVEQLEQDLHDLASSYELAVLLWREERETLADAVDRLGGRVEQLERQLAGG